VVRYSTPGYASPPSTINLCAHRAAQALTFFATFSRPAAASSTAGPSAGSQGDSAASQALDQDFAAAIQRAHTAERSQLVADTASYILKGSTSKDVKAVGLTFQRAFARSMAHEAAVADAITQAYLRVCWVEECWHAGGGLWSACAGSRCGLGALGWCVPVLLGWIRQNSWLRRHGHSCCQIWLACA
jgi:hypothetical protein